MSYCPSGAARNLLVVKRGLLTALVTALIAALPARASTESTIREVFKQRTPQALCIANAESSLNPHVVSYTGDYGLFQINYAAWHGRVVSYYRRWRGHVIAGVWMRLPRSVADFRRVLFNPRTNARAAWAISRGGTAWSPWSSFTVHGACH